MFQECHSVRLIVALAGILFLSPAAAQECPAFDDKGAFDSLSIAVVGKGQTRVHFERPECANGKDAAECRSRPFVVPGDVVLTGETFGAKVCAAFVNAKGVATPGLLPGDRLQPPSSGPLTGARAFLGTWKREEAIITVKPERASDKLSFVGEATYGMRDPGRVARGAVNLGDFDFSYRPEGNRLSVGLLTGEPNEDHRVVLQVKAGKDDCLLDMLALGPYLIVADNLSCGGNNVTFTGLYRRVK